jgi:hypothetical protein
MRTNWYQAGAKQGVSTMRKQIFFGVAAISLALAAVPLRAHHAFSAEFDADKPLKLEGTVSKTEWINPHAWIHIDVKKPDGKTEEWMIEGGTPNTLMRRGISRDTLKIGTPIVVTGYQAKDGSFRANGRDITYPDGRKLFLGSTGTGAPYEAEGNKDKDKGDNK